ncbi:MAG: ComEC/Rec2 family competence protein [Clostridia bacterium]|nr:ComEC/Rec2 family competence protein [Clostridia bacterium]
MGIFKNRPLALSICSYMLAALIGFQMNEFVKRILWISMLTFSAVLAVMAICRKRCRRWHSIVLLCMLGASVALFQSWFYFNQTVEKYRDRAEEITVEGYVLERLPSSAHRGRFAVMLQEADSERISEKFLLECEYASALQSGDRFRLKGTLRTPESTAFYDEETILTSDGYVGILSCERFEDCSLLEEKAVTLKHILFNLKNTLSDRLHRAVGKESGALASAFLLGDRTRLSDDTLLAFRRSGISHLLALSGLHVSILIFSIERLLRQFFLPKKYRIFAISIIALLYLGITGCAFSTVRSITMLFVVYLAYFAEEDYDAFTALCIALFLILFAAPYAVADVSMWLSFAATAGIVIFVPAVEKWFEGLSENLSFPKWSLRCIKSVLIAIAVGLFANAAILPLSAYFFGSTSVFSVLLTLLLSPILSLTLILCLLSLLLPWCIPIVFLTGKCLELILYSANRVSDLPNAIVLLDGTATVMLLALLIILLLGFSVLDLKKKGWLVLLPTVSFLVLFVAYTDVMPREMGASVTYLQSNFNEAIVIAEERNAIAIDFSDGRSSVNQLIERAVIDSKCTELQELILTHYHSEETNTVASLSARIKVRSLRLPIPNCEKESAIAKRLEQEAKLHGIRVIYGTENLPLKNSEILFLERGISETKIEVPTVLCMEINGHRMLCTSGEPWNGELSSALSSTWMHAAEIILLGAHGTTEIPEKSFFQNLSQVKQILFGTQELYAACPSEILPRTYSTAVESKRFFLK